MTSLASQALDIQGHRGARGLAPENTLPAFARALAIGVTTLELDCAVTKDGVVVVSHDPAFNPDITRGPDGKWLEKIGPAIWSLTFKELQHYDVGRLNPASSGQPTARASRALPTCSSWSRRAATQRSASISRPRSRRWSRRRRPVRKILPAS
jgi:glycerophosphoryl diester phosphodiesterase